MKTYLGGKRSKALNCGNITGLFPKNRPHEIVFAAAIGLVFLACRPSVLHQSDGIAVQYQLPKNGNGPEDILG
jgi:hypothetical protein